MHRPESEGKAATDIAHQPPGGPRPAADSAARHNAAESRRRRASCTIGPSLVRPPWRTVPHLDRDFKVLMVAIVLWALAVGMYLQLLFVYAMDLGATRFTIGWLNAVMLGTMAACYIPGAWATNHFRLKTIIVATWWLHRPRSRLLRPGTFLALAAPRPRAHRPVERQQPEPQGLHLPEERAVSSGP